MPVTVPASSHGPTRTTTSPTSPSCNIAPQEAHGTAWTPSHTANSFHAQPTPPSTARPILDSTSSGFSATTQTARPVIAIRPACSSEWPPPSAKLWLDTSKQTTRNPLPSTLRPRRTSPLSSQASPPTRIRQTVSSTTSTPFPKTISPSISSRGLSELK